MKSLLEQTIAASTNDGETLNIDDSHVDNTLSAIDADADNNKSDDEVGEVDVPPVVSDISSRWS